MLPDTARLFLALHLPDAASTALHGAGEAYLGQLEGVRVVSQASMHLTLAFLGERSRGQVDAIASAVAPVCEGYTAFSLRLDGAGCFPSARRPRVLWVGFGGELDALQRFQGGIEAALVGAQLYEPERGFRPHLTLARVGPLDLETLDRLGARWLQFQVPASPPIEIRHLYLMRSELGRERARYSVVQSWALAKKLT